MYPTQPPAPEYLDEMAWELTEDMYSGKLRGRDFWEGLELLQQVADYMGELAENPPPCDCSVTIGIEGHKVRFENVDAMANFIVVGVMKHGH